MTTLDLGPDGSYGERLATVYYPADPAGLAGHTHFSYRDADPLPAALTAIVPAKYNATVSTSAWSEAPGSTAGPFPAVLFSHGFGASRLYYSNLLTGIASWGFVIVSADYTERGLVAQAENKTSGDSPALDSSVMSSSLTALEQASSDTTSVLHGLVDEGKIAAVGHSAGGGTAFDALSDPRIATAVGWAPVGPSGSYSHKPVVIIGGLDDIALTPSILKSEYQHFPGPTTWVEVAGAGHDTFTDICTQIRGGGGGGLVGFALSLHLVSGELAKLAVNGCQANNLTPARFLPVAQAYTVAALRDGLHIDSVPRIGAPPGGAFAGVRVQIQHHG
ncbi:MAG TPA: hypothetical protein VKR22_06470 [Acidimicrobiales bacterium]|nr:hypothetical protein [Acidimicrobiales bacterium]